MNNIVTMFEDEWPVLREKLKFLADRVKQSNPHLIVKTGHYTTETFPFTGFVSFSKNGDPTIEDLVFTLGAKYEITKIIGTSDWAKGNGVVIKDGPAKIFDLSLSETELKADTDVWIDELGEFIDSSYEVVLSALKLL